MQCSKQRNNEIRCGNFPLQDHRLLPAEDSRPASDRGYVAVSGPSLLLEFRVSAAPKWLWGWFATTWNCKKFGDLGIESVGKPFQYRHCRIFQTTLKPAHVGPIDFGIHRERFLRESASNPQAA
jgi:hypothetical protein